MNCTVIQRRLLESERPGSPPAELEEHLAVCLSCQKWQQRLVQLEHHVPVLPIPVTSARATLLGQIAALPVKQKSQAQESKDSGQHANRQAAPVRSRVPDLSVPRRWGSLAAGAAAAVLLLGLSWWMLQGPGGTAMQDASKKNAAVPDPLLACLLQRDLRLAEAKTTRERVEVLAGLADDLNAETQNLARTADADDLQELARQYQRVVEDGVVLRARDLPARERLQVLHPIAARLARAGHDAESLAMEVPSAAGPLHRIADAARAGDGQLRGLLQE
jgi:hypothetical protein